MIQVQPKHFPIEKTEFKLTSQLRLLAPQLVNYDCELDTIVRCLETDKNLAKGIIKYANRRQLEPDVEIESVNHAVVFLGSIEAKHFLLNQLLLDPKSGDQTQQIQVLVRAKLVTELFHTTGPLNKDLAFVGAYLAHKKLLKQHSPEHAIALFRLSEKRKNALVNLDYGLRQTIEHAICIEKKCSPGSIHRRQIPKEFKELFHEALFWANGIIMSR
jgi:c-di-GMP-related signal transduction protein